MLIKRRLFIFYGVLVVFMGLVMFSHASCVPPEGCSTALAYYTFNTTTDASLSAVATRFQANESSILWYSRLNTSSASTMTTGQQLFIPFSCGCAGESLGHNFTYKVVADDKADVIASLKFEFLTSVTAMVTANAVPDLVYISPGHILKVPVQCFCGNVSVSSSYGLFATYVARENDNGASIAEKFNTTTGLLQSYNPDLNLNLLQEHVDVVFVPATDGNGVYPPYSSIGKGSSNSKRKVILGSSISACSLLIAITGVLLYRIYLHRHTKHSELRAKDMHQASPAVLAGGSTGGHDFLYVESPITKARSRSPSISDVSLEFSYQELAAATDNFSDSNKIGQGGYGSVFYGEIRGQKLAIKMMNMQATKEFLAELKVLTRVHHTNLVRLVGYCTTKALFLVYEYMDNGTLSDHLKRSTQEGGSPLSWTIRVQIALDAARGLEYIHEHTTPTYIHRDIKSSNILLDKHFHAKVADFGLTKLMESGNSSNSLPSRLVGTFGYMAPEYARFGNISAKADVYAFGVVLFQLISAKEAIIYGTEESSAMPWASPTEGLVTLFEKALSDTVLGKEKLHSLVDKAMGDDYPLESVWKMATLAAACTRKEALLRPNMRVVVVALLTLMTSPEDLDTDHIFQNVKDNEGL